MNLFRKKTTLPEGPARMSVSPSASKKEIGNPAASIGLVIPGSAQLRRGTWPPARAFRQLRDVLQNRRGPVLPRNRLHGRKAPRGNRGSAHPLHRNDGIHLSRSRSQPDHPGRTAPGAHHPETRSPPSPPSQSDTHAPRNPRDEGVGHEQSHEHRTALCWRWPTQASTIQPCAFSLTLTRSAPSARTTSSPGS